ncbi:MAG TPA: class I mannose-6-phosphate isomerase [Bacteroidota bacterium]|nr:class I mannose-6-phosphate isomerase [Bacteroidota bacterium]
MSIPPIIPLPANRVWRSYIGGKILDTMEGSSDPSDGHFPEDWIASTTAAINTDRQQNINEGLSTIGIDGDRETLKSLMLKYPTELLGIKHYTAYGPQTQFLLKFLDSAVRLHIQAHPTIEFAKQYLDSNSGKTEAYVILDTRTGVEAPYIYLGFQRPVAAEAFKEIIVKQDIHQLLSCFEKIRVKPGDVFYVPGGLPHAIGEGVLMIEMMEPTDFVVRLEFERGGYVLPEEARFMGRDIDFAMSMIDFSMHSTNSVRRDYFVQPRLMTSGDGVEEYVLIDQQQTSCFSLYRLNIKTRFVKRANSFYVGIVTKGDGVISAGDLQLPITKGAKFFVPFKTSRTEFATHNGLEVVLAFPPTEEDASKR